MIRGIIFDLDGTIVDAADWHKDALNLTLMEFGYGPIRDDEHEKIFNGLSTRRKMAMLAAEGRVDIKDSDAINRRKQEITTLVIKEKCEPAWHITELFEYLNRISMPVALATNCSRETTLLMLIKSEIYKFFPPSAIVTNEDVGGKIKPDPTPFVLAAQKLNLPTQVCLAIEDTDKGVESARAAGCHVLKTSFKQIRLDTLINLIHGLNNPGSLNTPMVT